MKIEIIKHNGRFTRLIDPAPHNHEILFSGDWNDYILSEWDNILQAQEKELLKPILSGEHILTIVKSFFNELSWEERENLFSIVNNTLSVLVNDKAITESEFESCILSLKAKTNNNLPAKLIEDIEAALRRAMVSDYKFAIN